MEILKQIGEEASIQHSISQEKLQTRVKLVSFRVTGRVGMSLFGQQTLSFGRAVGGMGWVDWWLG